MDGMKYKIIEQISTEFSYITILDISDHFYTITKRRVAGLSITGMGVTSIESMEKARLNADEFIKEITEGL